MVVEVVEVVDAIWLEVIPAVVVGVEVVASAAVSTYFWTTSVRTGVVDTVGLAFVDVIFDCCDAIIQRWG